MFLLVLYDIVVYSTHRSSKIISIGLLCKIVEQCEDCWAVKGRWVMVIKTFPLFPLPTDLPLHTFCNNPMDKISDSRQLPQVQCCRHHLCFTRQLPQVQGCRHHLCFTRKLPQVQCCRHHLCFTRQLPQVQCCRHHLCFTRQLPQVQCCRHHLCFTRQLPQVQCCRYHLCFT
jgi:hypothetical protein